MNDEIVLVDLKKYEENYPIELYFKYLDIYKDQNLSKNLENLHKVINNEEPLFDVFFRNLDKSYAITKENIIKEINNKKEKLEKEEIKKELNDKFNKQDLKKFLSDKKAKYLKMSKNELEINLIIKDLPKNIKESIEKQKFDNAYQVISYLEKNPVGPSIKNRNSFFENPYSPKKFDDYHKNKDEYKNCRNCSKKHFRHHLYGDKCPFEENKYHLHKKNQEDDNKKQQYVFGYSLAPKSHNEVLKN